MPKTTPFRNAAICPKKPNLSSYRPATTLAEYRRRTTAVKLALKVRQFEGYTVGILMGMGDCLERFCEEETGRPDLENDLEDGELNQRVVRVLLRDGGAVERVDLSRCELRFLPEAFGKIQGLLVLDVSHNQLEVIPDSLAGLQKLEELNVSSNLLKSLPDSIGLLSNLKVLNVSGNKLNALPASIARCSSLMELDASFNNLTSLPPNIGYGLLNLKKLSIHLNKIRTLPPSVFEIWSLQYLDAHLNMLCTLPSEIGKLANLEVLNLSSNFNDLTELPETIGDLLNLRELDISNNQIGALPDTFGWLENLSRLNLDQNPLVIPPKEIVSNGVEAVVEFMLKRWVKIIEAEEKRSMVEANKQGETGWLGLGTSVLNYFASGVSPIVTGSPGLRKAEVLMDP